jgi:hypothetical protein
MRHVAAPAALALAGAAVLLLAGTDSTAGVAVAIVLIGSAAVVAVAAMFYAIGRAEDRERAEAAEAAAQRAGEQHPPSPGLTPERRRPRPPRRPG